MRYCFGVDIGGTSVKMGLFSEEGAILEKWEIPTNTENHGEKILDDVATSLLKKMEEKRLGQDEIVGVGVGVPAPVSKTGLVKKAANLGWEDVQVSKTLEALLELPVVVGNDANVAALGEMWKGGGQGYSNMLLITLGTGVGGGVISDGRIVFGATGAAGEVGHFCVNPHETVACGCGRKGCLEQYASATGITRLAKKTLDKSNEDSVLRHVSSLNAKEVFDGVKANDRLSCEVADRFGRYLGHALANIAVLIDPDGIVVGGGVSKAGPILLEYIEKYFKEKAFFANQNLHFTLATLGNDAGIYGASKMILDERKER